MSAKQQNCLIDIEERIFYLSDSIDNNSVGIINFNILRIINSDNKKRQEQKNFKEKPIKLFINSFGGSVYDMWSLVDIILNSSTPIYTYCTGYAMSSGFLIFLAGHKRFTTKNTTILYHQLSSWNSGKFLDIAQNVEELTRLQSEIEKYVSSRTKITQNMLKNNRIKKIDWFIHSEDFEKYNIATIINNFDF